MFLNALFTIAIIFSVLFLALLFRAFSFKQLKQLWLMSRLNVINRKKHQEKVKKFEQEGLRKFSFSNGKIVVYAKTQARAIYDKNEIIKKQKRKQNAILRERQKQD